MTQSHARLEAFPDRLGDKNPETREGSWKDYQGGRPHEHDCGVNEAKNWYGNHRCRESWECKGARVCEKHVHGAEGLEGIGWCRGPDACPLTGPLDSYEEDHEDPGKGLKWNKGSRNRRDLDEWE